MGYGVKGDCGLGIGVKGDWGALSCGDCTARGNSRNALLVFLGGGAECRAWLLCMRVYIYFPALWDIQLFSPNQTRMLLFWIHIYLSQFPSHHKLFNFFHKGNRTLYFSGFFFFFFFIRWLLPGFSFPIFFFWFMYKLLPNIFPILLGAVVRGAVWPYILSCFVGALSPFLFFFPNPHGIEEPPIRTLGLIPDLDSFIFAMIATTKSRMGFERF